ncbi:MAG: hypothetical protein HQ522_18260 [Bacteroidetes bacterium]|nr:hypothetical protein [Bacteroidota bacterium]
MFACSLLDNDDDVPKNAAVDLVITENADYPVMGFEEDGTTYLFSDDLSKVYLRTNSGDEWSVNINTATGKPIDMYMLTAEGDFYIVFSNFDGDLADIAISKINSLARNPSSGNINDVGLETQYLLGVKFEGMSNAQPITNNKSAYMTSDSWTDFFVPNIKRTIGHVSSALGCGLGLAGAGVTFAGSAGTATPFSVVMATYACGSFTSGLLGDITGVKPFSDLSKGLAINGTTVDCVKAMATRSGADIGSCINDLVGLASGLGGDAEEIKAIVNSVINKGLQDFMKTGGLLGKWKADSDVQSNTVNSDGVTMTTRVNPPTIEFATSICNFVISGTITSTINGQTQTTDFSFGYKYRYTLTDKVEYDQKEKGFFNYVNFEVQGVTMYSEGTSTYISWSDFKSYYAQAGVGLPAEMQDMESFESYYGMFPADNSLVIDLFNGDDIVFIKELL